MKKFWEDFKKFISRGNVVDMAVGVAVASAFTAIVTAFTKGFISPILALLTNDADLSELKWIVRPEKSHEVTDAVTGEITKVVDVAEVSLLWGSFVQKIIDFLIIAFTLFLIMRIVSAFSNRSKNVHKKLRKMAMSDEELAAEAKKLEEEEAAKAKAEAEAKAEEERIAAEIQAEKDRLVREEALLTEIRDLLKKQ